MGKKKKKKGAPPKPRPSSPPRQAVVESAPLAPSSKPTPEKIDGREENPDHQPDAKGPKHPVPKHWYSQPQILWGIGSTIIFPSLFAVGVTIMFFFLQEHRYNLALIFGFVAWVALGAWGACYIKQHYIPSQVAPSALPPKPERPSFRADAERMTVTIGGSSAIIPRVRLEKERMDLLHSMFGTKSNDSLIVYVENGLLYVDVKLYNNPAFRPIEIKRNEYKSIPPQWDVNYNDKAIEVVNESLTPVLQLALPT